MTRRIGLMLVLVAALTTTVLTEGCAKAPLSLSPQARVAWDGIQVIRTLDLVRDVAIDANQKSLLSVETTRLIVQWHESALGIVHAAPSGWRLTVAASAVELRNRLPQPDRPRLDPYVKLLTDLLETP